MRRRLAVIAAVVAVTVAALSLALNSAASAAVVVTATLGRNAPTYTSPAGSPTPISKWVASAQGELLDTNGNGITDSLRSRAAVQETFGIVRVRITRVLTQALINGTWVTVQANEDDKVSDAARAYAVQYTAPNRLCATDPGLERIYRTVNAHAVRRVDGAVASRTTYSHQYQARGLATDPSCPENPPPPPPPDPANLQVTVADSPDPVQHGQQVTLNVTAANTGDLGAAGSVVVIDTDERLGPLTVTAPVGVTCTLIDLHPDPGTPGVDDEAVSCALGTLSGGESNLIRIVAVAGEAGTYETVAILSSTSAGVAEDEDTEFTTVVASANLALAKSAAPTASTSDPANVYDFTFTVSNAGPDPATGVTISDPWPAHLADPTVVPTGCIFNDTADTLTCEAGAVGIGAGSAETFVVTAAVLDDGTNTATVDGDQADPNLSNNTDSATVNL